MTTLSQLCRYVGGSIETCLRCGDMVENVVKVGGSEVAFFDDEYGNMLTLVE